MTDSDLPGLTGLLAWEHERFERVTAALDLDPATIGSLHCAERSLIVELPLRGDDGSMTVLTGYRVQHSNALGPTKGGTRFRPDVVTDAMALAGPVSANHGNDPSPRIRNQTRR